MKTKPIYATFNEQKKCILLFIICATFCFSKASLAQAPILGATTSFTLFTATGAFSNIGATNVTGDIGTNIGAFTGFPPGTIIGQIHVADSVTVQAAIDVDVAYSFLNNLTCDSTIGTTLGSNQTLTPRVYCLGGSSVLLGNLILDGQGDSNAIFNFKVNGMLSTSSLSQVVLINSASFKNVYWQINGAISLGDSSVFKGTVVANGAISMLNAFSISGRLLSRGGAISIDNSLSTLPVKLISFNVIKKNETTILNWLTSSEINNAYFLIERSSDAKNWNTIGKVTGSKNSVTVKEYFFEDNETTDGLRYYRLKQIDFDGKFEYSTILSINYNIGNLVDFIIYPNPTSGKVKLTFNEVMNEVYSVSIYNLLGECIFQSTQIQSVIDISTVKEGVYTLQVSSSSKMTAQKLVVKR